MATLKEYLEARRDRIESGIKKGTGKELRLLQSGQALEITNIIAVLTACQWDDYKPVVEAPECHWCKEKKDQGRVVYTGGQGDVWMCKDCEDKYDEGRAD